jgi:hypothetical protein
MQMLVGPHQDDGFLPECDPGEKKQKKRKITGLVFLYFVSLTMPVLIL